MLAISSGAGRAIFILFVNTLGPGIPITAFLLSKESPSQSHWSYESKEFERFLDILDILPSKCHRRMKLLQVLSKTGRYRVQKNSVFF